MGSKRQMTPAIPGLTVKHLRRALSDVRQYASENSPNDPIFITKKLPSLTDGKKKFSVQEFCLQFVRGHHNKRHQNAKRKKAERVSKNKNLKTE